MIEIDGYKQMNYSEFQKNLLSQYSESKKTYIQIATEIKSKSHVTVKNALSKGLQAVSDETLTKVMKSVGLSGFVVWIFGKKYYYIKNAS